MPGSNFEATSRKSRADWRTRGKLGHQVLDEVGPQAEDRQGQHRQDR